MLVGMLNVLIPPYRLLLNRAYVSIDSLCEKYLTHTIVPVSFNELNTKSFFLYALNGSCGALAYFQWNFEELVVHFGFNSSVKKIVNMC